MVEATKHRRGNTRGRNPHVFVAGDLLTLPDGFKPAMG
jgi:hypothetical protein